FFESLFGPWGQGICEWAGSPAATELTHRHGSFVEVIHRNLLVAEIYCFGHMVGDGGGQVGVTKIGPATKVHGTNIPLHVPVVSPCQHGTRKPDLFHLAQDLIVD